MDPTAPDALVSAGNDYIAGGPGADTIFGELGNDTIQGDSSIDYVAHPYVPIGAVQPVAAYGTAVELHRRRASGHGDGRRPRRRLHRPDERAPDRPVRLARERQRRLHRGRRRQQRHLRRRWPERHHRRQLRLLRHLAPEPADVGLEPDLQRLGHGARPGGSGRHLAAGPRRELDRDRRQQRRDHLARRHQRDLRERRRRRGRRSNRIPAVQLRQLHERAAARPAVAHHRARRDAPRQHAGRPRSRRAARARSSRAPRRRTASATSAASRSPATRPPRSRCNQPCQQQGNEIHVESGDAFVYGGPANDVIFGGGQNDTIILSYGDNWVSGGRGDQCIIGGGGRCFASRVSSSYGEPLYGIAADPGRQHQRADHDARQRAAGRDQRRRRAHVLGDPLPVQLGSGHVGLTRASATATRPSRRTASRTSSARRYQPNYGHNIIYGGWGNDTIHGGPGQSAISGADAPVYAFTDNFAMDGTPGQHGADRDRLLPPVQPGQPDGLQPAGRRPSTAMPRAPPVANKLDYFDPSDPRREILLTSTGADCKWAAGIEPASVGCLPWFLNFDPTQVGMPLDRSGTRARWTRRSPSPATTSSSATSATTGSSAAWAACRSSAAGATT